MSSTTLDYRFSSTGGGDELGFNNPTITPFQGKISYYLARESLQNITDQRKSNEFPARVSFKVYEINYQDLPDYQKLISILDACLKKHSYDEKNCSHFSEVKSGIERNAKLKVLKISDYNTSGMDAENDSGNFYKFFRSVGSSSKEGDSGGSYGLGKGAYFAASSCRMIFMTGLYDESKFLFYGKLRLASHDCDGDTHQENGSYSLESQEPLRDQKYLPKVFSEKLEALNRKEDGTDIYIIGFDENEDWENKITESILYNFWHTIINKELVVNIGANTIKHDNIEQYFYKHFKTYGKDTTDYPNPIPYYKAFASPTNIIEDHLPTLGSVKLYIKMDPNFKQRIVKLRKTGMVVERKYFGFLQGYSGVFICDDKEGNSVLRSMENQQHNEWHWSNARENLKYKDKAKAAYNELDAFILGSLEKLRPESPEGALEIPGLEDYLYLSGDEINLDGVKVFSGNKTDGFSSEETSTKKQKSELIKPNVEKYRKLNVIKDANTTGTVGGDEPAMHDGNGHAGKGDTGTPDIDGNVNLIQLKNVTFRSFAVEDSDKKINHKIILHGPSDKKLVLDITVGTDDNYLPVNFEKVTSNNKNVKFSGSKLLDVLLDSKGNANLDITFENNQRYSIRGVVYENK